MTGDQELVDLENQIATLRTQYQQAGLAYVDLLAKKSKKEDRRTAFWTWHNAGIAFFNSHDKIIPVASKLKADHDATWYTDRAETAVNLMETICLHYHGLWERCMEFGIDKQTLRPSLTAYANLQRITLDTHPDIAKKYRDEFVKQNLPTHGFDKNASEKPLGLDLKYFVLGCVAFAVALGFGIWGFQLRDLSYDQRNIFRAFMSIASGFASWCFSGSFSITGNHPVWKLLITATGGFGVWFASNFFMAPPSP